MLHQKGSMAMAVMVIRKTQAITVRGALRVRAYRHSVPTFRAATTTTVRTTTKEDSVPKALHRDCRTAEDNSRVHTVRTTTITIMQRAATSLVSSKAAIVHAITTTARVAISLVSSKVVISHARAATTTIVEATDSREGRRADIASALPTTIQMQSIR